MFGSLLRSQGGSDQPLGITIGSEKVIESYPPDNLSYQQLATTVQI
jgi:hypothetical protein